MPLPAAAPSTKACRISCSINDDGSPNSPTFGVRHPLMRATHLLLATILVSWSLHNAHAQTWADAGPDQYICGDSTHLQAAALTPLDSGYWFLSQGNATIVNPTEPNTLVTGLLLGENAFQWVVINGLGATTDFVSVWGYDETAPIANAGPDQVISIQQAPLANLSANPYQAPCACVWTIVLGTGTLGPPTGSNSFVAFSTPGPITLQWTCDNGGCGITTDQVVIDVVNTTSTGRELAPSAPTLFHDPGQDLFFLSGNQLPGDLMILNSSGQLVGQYRAMAGNSTQSTADLSPGLYIAHVRIGDRTRTLRFTVTH